MSETELVAKAAWLYHVAGLNQESTAKRLGITRARVNKMLSDARESGLVSISINQADVGLLPIEEALKAEYGLDFCICTPALNLTAEEDGELSQKFAFRAVGTAAAAHLRKVLAESAHPVVGTGWGRTIEQMTLQLAGMRAPHARFISLMGSLTANSAYNPFEVVHALARNTGGQGFFLPVPFIADSADDRQVLLSQRSVQRALDIARTTTVAYVSVGELTEDSLLRQQEMITKDELTALRDLGAVGDTNGIFFDQSGIPIEHDLARRTIAMPLNDLKEASIVALVAGVAKVKAAKALLRSGLCRGLVIDGDTALKLTQLT
ncbi:sugar-binding transcriptional regulator [Devosia sp.]|uniref:sugar-binding transcriptional regulator n=1 Tax=Devosia sp. TaxID=1871048 RepID=UPI002735F2F5|nr:sugar-binding transcriptional regulator [Devosia sp.]MDP2781882.1 sugar-binding transcriptional regulator [Devosia sp.]